MVPSPWPGSPAVPGSAVTALTITPGLDSETGQHHQRLRVFAPPPTGIAIQYEPRQPGAGSNRAPESRPQELAKSGPMRPVGPAPPGWFPRPTAVGSATWVRNLGAIVLLFVLWQLWGTSLTEHRAQRTLRAEFNALIASHQHPAGQVGVSSPDRHRPAASSTVSLVATATSVLPRSGPGDKPTASAPAGGSSQSPASAAIPVPLPGQAIAQIQIPKIGVSQYVVEGTSEADLSMGVGHYIGSALPGGPGNSAMAGHRTTYGAPFNQLNELATGDAIYTTTTAGRAEYVVTQPPFAVSPSDISVLDNFGDSRLTLTTCNPEFSATSRLIVVARLVQPASWVVDAAVPPAKAPAGAAAGDQPATVDTTPAVTVAPTRTTVAPLRTTDRLARVTLAPTRKVGAHTRPSNVSRPAALSVKPPKGSNDDMYGAVNASKVIPDPVGWHFGALGRAAGATAIIIALGLGNPWARRFFGRPASWLVRAPIWACGLYLLFVAMGGLLPANI
jgi:LPXTG-site transpeptidase (sortase) family protein